MKFYNMVLSSLQVTMTNTWGSLKWGMNGMTFPEIPLTMDKFLILAGRTAERKALGEWAAGMPGTLMFKSGMNLVDHQASAEGMSECVSE